MIDAVSRTGVNGMGSIDSLGELKREISLVSSFQSIVHERLSNATLREMAPPNSEDIRHTIENLIALANMVDESSRRYTMLILADRVSYEEELDDKIKGLWKSWLELANNTISRDVDVRRDLAGSVTRLDTLKDLYAIAKQHEAVDFDHHAKAIINAYKPNMENFMDAKFPQEFWDSPE